MLLYYIIIAILGLIMGSFSCCMGYRIPNKISVIKPGSFCPHCKKKLKWYMNIPLISYIILHGDCAYCKKQINPVYPLIEFTTMVLYVLAFYRFGISNELIISLILTTALIITSVTDFKYYYISDRVVFISLAFILIDTFFTKGIYQMINSCLYAFLMFALMYLIKILGNIVFKKESLGDGDIKLSLIIGAAVGFLPGILTIFVASILGLFYALILVKRHNIIPFGPFLLLATLLVYYLYDDIMLVINYILK